MPLIADAPGQRQRPGEEVLQGRIARDLAGDVADHPPEHGSEAPQRLVGPLELLGVGIALVLDQRPLADPGIGLAQGDAVRLCEPHQVLAGPVHQLGVGREGDGLLLHGRVGPRLDRGSPG